MADKNNHRIQIFIAEGKFSRIFVRRDQALGELALDMLLCVAVDTSGIVYVSEGIYYLISLFTPEGRFVTSFGKKGDGPGFLMD